MLNYGFTCIKWSGSFWLLGDGNGRISGTPACHMPSNEGTEIGHIFRRLREYDAMVPRPTETSVAYNWLERYERERTHLGIDTPPRK